MTRFPLAPVRAPRRPAPARAALTAFALMGLTLGAGACLDRPVAPAAPRTSNTFAERVAVERINKIDLLFMVDNSISMADKQTILAKAVPDLLNRLITPNCVAFDAQGQPLPPVPPNQTTGLCENGAAPEFNPVGDIHIGVLSSSLGGHGGSVCEGTGGSQNDAARLIRRGKDPVTGAPIAEVPTYRGLGFLAWSQGDDRDPDAENDRGRLNNNFAAIVGGVGQDGCGLESSLESWYRFLIDPNPPTVDVVQPENGQLPFRAATLRGPDATVLQQRADFLRPDSLVAVVVLSDENDCSLIDGVYPPQVRDPESGENRPWPESYSKRLLVGDGRGNQGFFPANYLLNTSSNGFLQSGSRACAENPYSPDCFNCLLIPAEQREAAGCVNLADQPTHDQYDPVNLRCFEQRRRFGIEALHPVQRYIDALTQRQIYDTSGALLALNPATANPDAKYFADSNPANRDYGNLVAPPVTNPLFDDLAWRQYEATACTGEGAARTCDETKRPAGRSAPIRRPDGRIYFAGIVGVPWQDIANNPRTLADAPNSDGTVTPGGFKAALTEADWNVVLGRPLDLVPPGDPLMRESVVSRINPGDRHPVLTDVDLSAPWNPINGHEWNVNTKDDLQYACIFPLEQDLQNCVFDEATQTSNPPGCDCYERTENETDLQATKRNPLCESYAPAPGGVVDDVKAGTGTFTRTQARAKAYPGLRFLEVLRGIGSSAIVASICPETQDDTRAHYGYRPAVNAIIDRLKNALKGRCLPRRLDVQGDQSPCLVVEARNLRNDDGSSSVSEAERDACARCDAPGYGTLDPALRETLRAQETPGVSANDINDYDCLCQFRQLTPATGLRTCQTDARDPSQIADVNGWCYVDPLLAAPEDRSAQEAIVRDCAAAEKRTLRFVGTRDASGGVGDQSSLFITCLGAASNSTANGGTSGASGAAGASSVSSLDGVADGR